MSKKGRDALVVQRGSAKDKPPTPKKATATPKVKATTKNTIQKRVQNAVKTPHVNAVSIIPEVADQGQYRGFPKKESYRFVVNWLKKDEPVSIFNKLAKDDYGIDPGSSDDTIMKFLVNKYKNYMKTFGPKTYENFKNLLIQWNVYPVPITFTNYLNFYIGSYDSWVREFHKTDWIEFHQNYVIYENDLIDIWNNTILTEYADKPLETQQAEFIEFTSDFIPFIEDKVSKNITTACAERNTIEYLLGLIGTVGGGQTFVSQGSAKLDAVHPGEFAGWSVYETIGDGSCLIHAFLGSISPVYRTLTPARKSEIATEIRRNIFGACYANGGMGRNVDPVVGMDVASYEFVSNPANFLQDRHIQDLANLYGVNIYCIVGGHVAPGMGDMQQGYVRCFFVGGERNQEAPFIFIYSDGNYHYETVSTPTGFLIAGGVFPEKYINLSVGMGGGPGPNPVIMAKNPTGKTSTGAKKRQLKKSQPKQKEEDENVPMNMPNRSPNMRMMDEPAPRIPSPTNAAEAARINEVISENRKKYNKLLNCLDIGKDAYLDGALSIVEHSEFMMKNVIEPLFKFESIDSSIRDPYNFRGVGNKSKELISYFLGSYDTNISYIPVLKDRTTPTSSGTIDPSKAMTSATTAISAKGIKASIESPTAVYTLQDAGYAPQYLFQDYRILLTPAGILDPAGKTKTKVIDLTVPKPIPITEETLQKYSLDTCINSINVSYNGVLYRFDFKMKDSKLNMTLYFNNSYSACESNGDPFPARIPLESPQNFAAGNPVKNGYIKATYNDADPKKGKNMTKLNNIQKFVVIKELGDTLQVATVDQLLMMTPPPIAGPPSFNHDNTILSTNDYILTCRCLLNNINCVMTAGKNVIASYVPTLGKEKTIAVPYYRLSSPKEIRERNELLKKQTISDLYSKNKYTIDILREITIGDAIDRVYFTSKVMGSKIPLKHTIMERYIYMLQLYISNGDPESALYNAELAMLAGGRIPADLQNLKDLYRRVLDHIARCLEFVNERIHKILTARSIQGTIEGDLQDHKFFYESFLMEAARFRFECPFDVIREAAAVAVGNDESINRARTENTINTYILKQSANSFTFMPYVYGQNKLTKKQLENETDIQLEKDFSLYKNQKSWYTDFSLFNYFKIYNKDDIANTGKQYKNLKPINYYDLINNRIEVNSFSSDQLHGILDIGAERYLVITSLLYGEIDMAPSEKELIFARYINAYTIGDLLTFGWTPSLYGSVEGQTYSKVIRDVDINSIIRKLSPFNNVLDPSYAINGVAPPAFNTTPIPIKEIKWSVKEQSDRDKVYLPEKVDTVIEDTIIYKDPADYPGGSDAIAMAYLRRAIALAVNDAIEELEIPAVKGHINSILLTPARRNEILKMVDQLSTTNFRTLKTEIFNIIINAGPVRGITKDMVMLPEIIEYIHKQIKSVIPTFITAINQKVAKYGGVAKGGEPNANDPVANANDPTGLAMNKTPAIDVKTSAAFQKFFEVQGDTYKPGLFTYHVLCYMPNVILLAYAFAKYIESTTGASDVYDRMYPDMPLDMLKMYASKFFDFDYSNDLNHVFRNIARGGEPAYVNVDPADLQMDDAMMLVLIQMVAGMLIDGDMRAYTNAGLAVDLAPFKGESNELFTYVRDDPEKLTIVRYYDLIYSAEEYVCDAKLLPRGGNAIELFEHFVANGVYDVGAVDAENVVKAEVTVTEPSTTTVVLNIPEKTPVAKTPARQGLPNTGLGEYAPKRPTYASENVSSNENSEDPTRLLTFGGTRGKTRAAGRSCAPRHTRKRGKRRSPFGEPGPANAGRRGNTPKK